ncbi:MAG: DUF1549 and DUF1553 domain-containing protein [Pirellulaceae bacterium]
MLIVSLLNPLLAAEPAISADTKSLVIQSITVEPQEVLLRGENRRQQLLVTGLVASGKSRDATVLASLESLDPKVARIEEGVVVGVADGATQVRIRLGEQETLVPVKVAGFGDYPPVHFINDVAPIFSKLGCNSGGCHGRAAGQNGFKLSVFGFDPAGDYDALAKQGRGRRILPASPEHSLLLAKPTARLPHGGGLRLTEGSPDHELLVQWIRQGMPWGKADSPTLKSLRISPTERVLGINDRQQILATAIYSDGQERDVTAAASYASNATHVAEVDHGGVLRSGTFPGQAAVTVAYMGQVAAVKVVIPRPDILASLPVLPVRSPIDELVGSRLKLLGIPPSAPADDATFLRRVFLDTIGRLPTPDETREFLGQTGADKRTRWIEKVLSRDEYADFWTMKWGDILLVDRQKLGDRGAFELHRWLKEQFAANRPYNEWASELITATGNSAKNGPANFYRTMDNPEGLARVLSQAFLGVRMECAQCHHHPFEKWSQDDFYGLAGFFTGLERQPLGTDRVLVYHAGLREMRVPFSDRLVPTRVLDGPALTAVNGDPRGILAKWMTAPENPWFARLAANRLWKHFLGRGLVEAEDDLRSTNPPTNGPLLDYLANRLIAQHFDLKLLSREIMDSNVYQLSSTTIPGNQDDEQSFSHYLAKRLPAEVMLDAISDVTGVDETFPGRPPGTRAVQLWDNRLPSYFLEIFGRPERTSPCECGRSSEPTMAQALHLMNSPEIETRLASSRGRVAKLAASGKTGREIADELCLTALGRLPNSEERKIADQLFEKASRQEAAADFLWTLLNSRDFLFNH